MELLFPVLLFAVMYFVLIRPQKQRVAAQRALAQAIDVGDEVVTIGGLLGRVVELDDDDATIETTPGTRLRCRRAAISARLNEPLAEEGDA